MAIIGFDFKEWEKIHSAPGDTASASVEAEFALFQRYIAIETAILLGKAWVQVLYDFSMYFDSICPQFIWEDALEKISPREQGHWPGKDMHSPEDC